jgi:DNA-binding Lrp family transcriptional regulator
MTGYSPVERRVLTQLQRGIDLVERPFQGLELSEDAVIGLVHRAMENGLIRRFGGVFDARRLGYKSVLCALDVLPDHLAEKTSVISAHPGVTHCYERHPLRGDGSYPRLWFTLAMLQDEFDQGTAVLRSQLETGNSKLFELPALQRFKIDVVFDLQSGDSAGVRRPATLAHDEPVRTFSGEERAFVRLLDQQISIVSRPFAALAEQLGQTEEFVLSILQAWREQGVLRRIGAILYHREAGFKANAMCVWPVDSDVAAAGQRVAARLEVTHCYQRPRFDSFPFDLYAMIHAGSWEEAEAMFDDISWSCGLLNGMLFASGQEFKKSSMKYFRT